MLNSTQEKDHSLRNMAYALDHAMDEVIELTQTKDAGTVEQIRTRAEGMKQYAHDLQALAGVGMIELQRALITTRALCSGKNEQAGEKQKQSDFAYHHRIMNWLDALCEHCYPDRFANDAIKGY